MSDYIQQQSVMIDYHAGESWIILNEIEQSIKNKIEAVGTPLKDWDISINYGIKTGLNEAFIISKEKRDELIAEDPKSAEIIRPILRGRDIIKNGYNFADLYVITAYKGINQIMPQTYPAVFHHLSQFETKLKRRGQVEGTPEKPGSNQHHWLELDNNISLEKLDDFSRQNLIYPETTQDANFAINNNGFVIDKTAFMIVGENLNYLQSTLSSDLFKFAYKKFFSSIELGENAYQYNKHALIKLPIIRIDQDLTLKEDELYRLYNLDLEEIKYIKTSLL